MPKPVLAIIGTGWGGFPVAERADLCRYDVKVISPQQTLQYTPLLASAACGLFDFRLAEEPVKRQHRAGLTYYKACAVGIDLDRRVISCKPYVDDLSRVAEKFEVPYDKLVIAPGCEVQTFGTPGAKKYALFLQTTSDARNLQHRILQMLDAASLPGITEEQQREILHIRIIGGGPTGIEATAELHDLWHDSMKYLYPHLDGKVRITIHDVASQVMTTFDEKLHEHAMQSLQTKEHVEIKTSNHIEKVEEDAIYTKEDGRLPYGLLLWATGNKSAKLLDQLDVKKPAKGLPRMLTDKHLRVLRPDGSPFENTWALGDAADIEGQSLPTLAEVALQKGEYLAGVLNRPDGEQAPPFEYKQKANEAYLGEHDAIVGGKADYSGREAWIAWQSRSLGWVRSWRRRVQISISWMLVWLNGRDIARK